MSFLCRWVFQSVLRLQERVEQSEKPTTRRLPGGFTAGLSTNVDIWARLLRATGWRSYKPSPSAIRCYSAK